MLAVELVRRGAARYGSRTAVVFGGRSLSFAEVDTAANRIAHVLASLGVARRGRCLSRACRAGREPPHTAL